MSEVNLSYKMVQLITMTRYLLTIHCETSLATLQFNKKPWQCCSIDLKMLSLYIFLKLFFRMRRIKFWRPTRGSIWWVGLNDFIHSHHLRHRIDFFILPCAHKRAKLKSPHIITIFLLILKFHLIFTLDFFLSNSQLCFTGLERSELDMESCELQWR